MKIKQGTRRCCECKRRFDPDPRVGDRQVTCGAVGCQRERHSERCRQWHAANGELSSTHYQDVVVPFRERQPSYQRRWRLAWRLREIREGTRPVGRALVVSLRALVWRAEKLRRDPSSGVQSGVFSGGLLDQAVVVLRGAVRALEALEASMTELGELAL